MQDTVRARAAAGEPCGRCGHLIDLSLPANHRMAFSAGHIVDLILGGAGIDPANLRPEHRGCNSSAGATLGNRLRARRPRPPRTLPEW